MFEALAHQPQIPARNPIHSAWDWLSLPVITTCNEGMPVTTPDFDAELHVETTTIMFADVVESVRLIEQDELGNVTRIRALLLKLARDAESKFLGTLLERRGDGLLIKFADAHRAVACSRDFHHSCVVNNIGQSSNEAITLRIGLHSGEVLTDRLALFGRGVNIAARIATVANPGETAVTSTIRDQLVDDVDATIEDMGDCYVRSLSLPIRAFRVGAAVHSHGENSASGRLAESTTPAIAVIPFATASLSAEVRAVGELLAECVIAQLSRAPSLRVISGLSSRVFRDVAVDATTMCSQLRCNYLLSGSYTAIGDRLVAFVELADGSDGSVIWADRLSGLVSDLLTEDSELVSRITTTTQLHVLDVEMTRARLQPLPNLRSYTLFLGGLSLMHRQSQADFERARELLQHLKERHPRNAMPRAWLGKWHMLRVAQGWAPDPHKDSQTAMIEAKRALEIDPENSLCLTVKGVIHGYLQKDFSAASDCYSLALLSNPSDPLARLQKAALAGWRGDATEAVESAGEAMRLSPLDPHLYFLHSLVAGAFLGAGDYKQAVYHAERSIRANRMHVATHKVLAMAHGLTGNFEASRRSAIEVLKLSPDFTVHQFQERSPWQQHPRINDLCTALVEAGISRN